MEITFNDLKYLVTVVADDLLNDDFGNLQDRDVLDSEKSDVSDEIYDKVSILGTLLMELSKHRPIPF